MNARPCALILAGLGLFCFTSAARGQFVAGNRPPSEAEPPKAGQGETATDYADRLAQQAKAREAKEFREQKYFGGVNLYPLAVFQSAGLFPSGTAGNRSDFGGLVSADLGLKPARSRALLGIGGWYWTNGPRDLYEVHARVGSKAGVGVQMGYITSTKVAADAMTLFLTLDLPALAHMDTGKRGFDLELGLGAISDFTGVDRNVGNSTVRGSRNTADFTMYMQASVEIAPRLKLTATEWYLRDRVVDLNRLTLGISHSF